MRGIVIGKFYPPHLGHNYLIDTALKNCDDVDVLVVDNPAYAIPAVKRKEWLLARHPKAHIQIVPDIHNDDDSELWATHTINFLGYRPDIVFSSEEYGKPWAEAMGCQHVTVDIDRKTVPISGTLVRQDLLQSWHYLSDETKAGLALRVVVLGAESTGTTTLAHDLAAALNVPWVPEVGRYYTESIATSQKPWQEDDFHQIARLQQSYESAIAARCEGVIVCDTNSLATELWQRRYTGDVTRTMKMLGEQAEADLYIITGDEIPFVQDGFRDDEHIRHDMHNWFVERIKKTGTRYIIVRGTPKQRLAAALSASHAMIQDSRIIK